MPRKANHANQRMGDPFKLVAHDFDGNTVVVPEDFWYLQEALDFMYDIGNGDFLRMVEVVWNGHIIASYTFN